MRNLILKGDPGVGKTLLSNFICTVATPIIVSADSLDSPFCFSDLYDVPGNLIVIDEVDRRTVKYLSDLTKTDMITINKKGKPSKTICTPRILACVGDTRWARNIEFRNTTIIVLSECEVFEEVHNEQT